MANKTFISSTNWTEKVGTTAAIATIKKSLKNKIFNHNIKMGKAMKRIWGNLAKKYGLEIQISGLDTLPSFSFKNDDNQKMQTYFTREMLKQNILAFRQFRPSYAHKEKHLNIYRKYAEKIFFGLSKKEHLKLSYSSIAFKSFSRLTKE